MRSTLSFLGILFTTILGFQAHSEQRYPDIRSVESKSLCADFYGIKGYYSGFSVKNDRVGICPEQGVAFGFEIDDANVVFQSWTASRANEMTATLITSTQDLNSKKIYRASSAI